LIVKAVTVLSTAQRARLMAVGELIAGEAGKGAKDRRPMAVSEICDACHALGRELSCFMASAMRRRMKVVRFSTFRVLASIHASISGGRSSGTRFTQAHAMCSGW
jgi:hypothetical protein